MNTQVLPTEVAIIGGGFSGLAAAYELARRGVRVCVFEAEHELGGLAGAFEVGGTKLDRFYHHWFTNDRDVMGLIEELGLHDRVRVNATRTGMYFANRIYKLSTPADLLKFSALPFVDRLRLGWLTLRVRRIRDWRQLENLTAREWLIRLGGLNVYRVVWQPLLEGKFGPYADTVSAVWFWNKLKLRGGSRGKKGEERLAYFAGGFVGLAQELAARIQALGGEIRVGAPVTSVTPDGSRWTVSTPTGALTCRQVISTLAPALTAQLVASWAEAETVQRLGRINYLANVCLVLELHRSLSSTYWLNVNDASFPFVGVIEHTNFEAPETYGGNHIVYLSKYLPHTDAMYAMSGEELYDFAVPHLKRMFPQFSREWVRRHHVWKARWAQPVVERNYSALVPPGIGLAPGLHLCSMAHIYPEDRGTNYAIREGRRVGVQVAELLASRSSVAPDR